MKTLNFKKIEQYLTLYILYFVTYSVLFILLAIPSIVIAQLISRHSMEDLGFLIIMLLIIGIISFITTPIICWKIYVSKYNVINESDRNLIKKILIISPILFPIVGNSVILMIPALLVLIVLKMYNKNQPVVTENLKPLNP